MLPEMFHAEMLLLKIILTIPDYNILHFASLPTFCDVNM